MGQVSNILSELVDLGIVDRREAPPSALFRLCRESVVGGVLSSLSNLWGIAVGTMSDAVSDMYPLPVSVVLFGSFARRSCDSDSDVDVLFVRPDDVGPEDASWTDSIEEWRCAASVATGNPIDILDFGHSVVVHNLRHGGDLWNNIRLQGVTIYGDSIDTMMDTSLQHG